MMTQSDENSSCVISRNKEMKQFNSLIELGARLGVRFRVKHTALSAILYNLERQLDISGREKKQKKEISL